MKKIALISTGGTIEKTYDEFSGLLSNHVSVLDVMVAQIQLLGVQLVRVPLMNKDSLAMTPGDHALIANTAGVMAAAHDGVVIVHGTDTLAVTGETCHETLGINLAVPVVLTGAMRPYQLRTSDALQNLTESLLAVQLLSPGVYAVMHNQVLRFPGVCKDRDLGSFTTDPSKRRAPQAR